MAMEASMHSGNEEQQQQQQQQQQEKKASQLFAQRALQERRLKPPDQVVPCPRCQSLNTKFCYYNNYSLTQPRHFCKNCRRYWTAGGTLRNVPVGGGCRKNKRAKHQQQQQQHRGNAVDHSSVLQLQPSVISGISTVTDSFSAQQQQQQHSAQLQGSSSSASFFNGEPAGAMHFLTSSQQQQQQQPTWSSQQSDVQANVEAAGALAFTTHSGQGGPAGQNLSHHSQAFANSGIMSLGLFNSLSSKSDAGAAAGGGGGPGLSTHTSQQVHAGGRGGDLTAFFENPAAAYSTRVGNLGALSEAGHHGSSYNHNTVSSDDIAAQEASSYARGGGGGGDIWRNLQQQQQLKQEVLWGQPESERSASVLDLNSRQQASNTSAKFSSPGSTLSPAATGAGHGLLDHAESKLAVRPAAVAVGWQQQQQQQQQSASHHHHQSGGIPNYETVPPPDTHFWSNPGWPPLDLHALHGSGGTQLL